MKTTQELIKTYNMVAEDYARSYGDELDRKPFDRELLERVAAGIPTGKRVADIGCGPGHIGAYLHSLGVETIGIDIAPEMVETARKRYPFMEFQTGDMEALELPDASLGGIVAFYSIIHIDRDRIGNVCREMARVLSTEGDAVLTFHCGAGELWADEWFGTPYSYRAVLFQPEEIEPLLKSEGFNILQSTVRQPYPSEHQTERAYIWARKE